MTADLKELALDEKHDDGSLIRLSKYLCTSRHQMRSRHGATGFRVRPTRNRDTRKYRPSDASREGRSCR